jgi:hypothetical protein
MQPAAGPEGTSFPPFFRDAACQRGSDLPLPLGASLKMMSINRPTASSRVQADVNLGALGRGRPRV